MAVSQGAQPLSSGAISALRPGGPRPDRIWTGGAAGWPLPMSEGCLACGADNPLGLQVRLRFDEEGVWGRLEPRDPWRAPGERLHPALAPVLLDEAAWWLGALVMQEGGLTNRVAVTLLEPDAPFGGPLLVAGRFDQVRPVNRKQTFWRTEIALLRAGGHPLATASIVFRGGPDYSTRQMDWFRARTPAETFRRMFPAHAS